MFLLKLILIIAIINGIMIANAPWLPSIANIMPIALQMEAKDKNILAIIAKDVFLPNL